MVSGVVNSELVRQVCRLRQHSFARFGLLKYLICAFDETVVIFLIIT